MHKPRVFSKEQPISFVKSRIQGSIQLTEKASTKSPGKQEGKPYWLYTRGPRMNCLVPLLDGCWVHESWTGSCMVPASPSPSRHWEPGQEQSQAFTQRFHTGGLALPGKGPHFSMALPTSLLQVGSLRPTHRCSSDT